MEKLTPQDLQQIQQKGLNQEDIEKQVRNFEQGFPYTHLVRPARIGDGIYQMGQVDLEHFQHTYHRAPNDLSVTKFVPASGAATRMFKSLFEYLDDPSAINPEVETLIQNLPYFAFYDDLRSSLENKGQEISQLIDKQDYLTIIRELVDESGLGYGARPKGLIKFHHYSDHSRTPAEEHLVEGAHYSQNHDQKVKIHFTVLPEHEDKFRSHIRSKQQAYEKSYDVNYQADFSNQHESTDMVAVDMNNQLVRQSDGRLLFRPGGHGALLNNLNDLEEDLIFIKNIDNVVPDRFKQTTYDYKKALAGMLLEYQHETFQYLREMESDGFDPDRLPE